MFGKHTDNILGGTGKMGIAVNAILLFDNFKVAVTYMLYTDVLHDSPALKWT